MNGLRFLPQTVFLFAGNVRTNGPKKTIVGPAVQSAVGIRIMDDRFPSHPTSRAQHV